MTLPRLLRLLAVQPALASAFVIVPPRAASFHTTTLLQASIADQVQDQMKTAMRAKDTTTLATLRLIKSAFANAAIESKVDQVNDDQAVDVLRKLAKMRKESIDMYQKGGATERADAEQAELELISQWLPTLADKDQTRMWVQDAIAQAGEPVNIGKVMGALMKAHKGQVDGSLAQEVVKEEVGKL